MDYIPNPYLLYHWGMTCKCKTLTDRITVTDEVAFKETGTVMFSYMTMAAPENVTEDSFTLQGKRVRFDPSLRYELEEIDCTIPEAEPIPGFWGVDKLYRITLATKEKIAKKPLF